MTPVLAWGGSTCTPTTPWRGGTNSLSPRESSLRSVCRQVACKSDYTLEDYRHGGRAERPE